MKKFDSELESLKHRLVQMSGLAQSMVALAASAVKDRTKDVDIEIQELERQVDQMQVEIDHNAIRMLTVYGPVASDLRYVLVVNHITSQLERMGDQVLNVCESLQLMSSDPSEHRTLPKLQKMADLVVEMVNDAMDAYFDKDSKKAEMTRSHDDLVDALNDQIVRDLLTDTVLHEVLAGNRDISDAVAQILVARSLERIADQAVNICKEVIYMIKGDDVRHRKQT